jgi:oxygen-dependent protoporphyrinogen oxidase
MVPQLAKLAEGGRSLLLAAQRARRTLPASNEPVFCAPRQGMEALAQATAAAAEWAGATIATGTPVAVLERDGDRWRADDESFGAIVLASPARSAASLVGAAASSLAAQLATVEYASVAIVTMAVPSLPSAVRGLSGYLVPKPAQRSVTAVSFGSQKWEQWRGDDEVVRVSLGRDGLPIDDVDDSALTAAAVEELGHHLGCDVQPTAVRVSRWLDGFPQYRPGHLRWLAALDAALPPGLFVTGSSYRGIGIASCIADAELTAASVADFVRRP